MSLVRAILRSPVKDLTVVSYGGPDIGLLCAAGKVRKAVYGFVSLDTIPLEPHFRVARQTGTVEAMELDEGMLLLGLQAAAWRVPFLPTRAGLGTDILPVMPEIRMVRSPYPGPDGGEGEELVAMPALELDVSFIHMNRADQAGNGQFLGPDLYMDDWFALAGAARRSCRASRSSPPRTSAGTVRSTPSASAGLHVDGVIEAPNGAHFTECPPDYGRDEAFQKEYALAAGSPETVGRVQRRSTSSSNPRPSTNAVGGSEQMSDFTRAEVCCVAMAECFRGDGERLCNPIGTIPMIGGRLARETFEPALVMTDGYAMFTSSTLRAGRQPVLVRR